MKEREFIIILKPAGQNWSAWSPDIPGCIASGRTHDETVRNFAEELELHFEGLLDDGLPIPEPASVVEKVRIEF